MSVELARAHILGQERIRQIIARIVASAWTGLPGHDERDVAQFVETVAPAVLAAQRQSVSLTDAYIALSLERQPLGIDPTNLIGAAVRNGTTPEEEWRRPFVTVWTALSKGDRYADALNAGQARADGMAATDIQLSMRSTLSAVGELDDRILGYQRVPDGSACTFCRLVAGQRYHTAQLMPIHTHCGCGVEVITEATRGDFTGSRDRDLTVTRDGVTAAVREHGELGPLLVDGKQHFDHL